MEDGTKMKYDLSGKKVKLPNGTEFEFQWEVGAYPAPRRSIEDHGLVRAAVDSAFDDILALADVLRAVMGLKVSTFSTRYLVLWHLYYRIDCLLQALCRAAPFRNRDGLEHETERALQSIFEFEAEFRAAADEDDDDDDIDPLGLIRALMGGGDL